MNEIIFVIEEAVEGGLRLAPRATHLHSNWRRYRGNLYLLDRTL
jgi:hypothetical protein